MRSTRWARSSTRWSCHARPQRDPAFDRVWIVRHAQRAELAQIAREALFRFVVGKRGGDMREAIGIAVSDRPVSANDQFPELRHTRTNVHRECPNAARRAAVL